MPEKWDQVKELFALALERDPQERTTFLCQACAGDDSLRTEIESLLSSFDGTATFLEDCPAADLLSGADAVFQVPSIFDAEVLSALRGLVRGGKFDRSAATDLIADLIAFRSSAGTCRLCSRECGSCGRTSILTMPRWPR